MTKDMSGGLFERFRSMPLQPSSLMVGHVIGGYIRNVLATTVVFGVALLIGFRPEAGLELCLEPSLAQVPLPELQR